MNRITLIFGLLFCMNSLCSQELYETTLSTNPVLVKKYAELSQTRQMGLRAAGDTIPLPPTGILDDFSYEGPYPDTALWMDDFVYINRGYAKAPITTGVATFDGLNNNGLPWNWSVTSTSSNLADYLTSKPIDLSTVLLGDTTLYLSFYYQVEGIGNDPETKDSLVVEFKEVGGLWNHIWSKAGSALSASDSSWKYVMLPIRDTAYLGNGFQFRFKNYATLLGNLDHWHIDYVYLNKNRYTATDTTFEDVSFVYQIPPLLNGYSAMPWRHYDTTDMRSNYTPTIRNNHGTVKFADFQYRIYNGIGTQVDMYSGGALNVDPYDSIGYFFDPAWTNAPVTYNIPLLTGPETYTMKCILNSPPDFNRKNDTIEHHQEFAYHYAYDDGTAESAVGAYTTGSTIDIAVKYDFSINDTLRYIDIYFNPIVTNASFYLFKLKVWSGGGTPGSVLFTSAADLSPSYYGTGTNMFIRYPLSTPLYLTAGTYFVGLLENTNWFLNIGLDKSTNTADKVYYNTGGGWSTTPIVGSMMIRPVFGNSSDFVGVDEVSVKKESDLTVYPNPANDQLFFSSSTFDLTKTIRYEIVDLYGRKMMQEQTTTASADVSGLAGGIYFIRIEAEGKVSTQKFIITH